MNNAKHSATSKVIEHFRFLADDYDHTTEWRRHPQLLELIGKQLSAGELTLDIGHGTGLATIECRNVVALDVSDAMLRKSRVERKVVGKAEQLPFASRTFDAVVLRQVLHYTNDAECMEEVTRILKPGGIVVVQQWVLPDRSMPRFAQMQHTWQPLRRRSYSLPTLSELCDRSLRVVSVSQTTVTRVQSISDLQARVPNVPWADLLQNLRRSDEAQAIKLDLRTSSFHYEQLWITLVATTQ